MKQKNPKLNNFIHNFSPCSKTKEKPPLLRFENINLINIWLFIKVNRKNRFGFTFLMPLPFFIYGITNLAFTWKWFYEADVK